MSRRFRFIYIRTAKSSSSSILLAIKNTFCGGQRCGHSYLKQVKDAAADVSDADWRSFFVFTWLRNPFTRLASAYFMFSERFLFSPNTAQRRPLPHERCTIPFLDFTANSYNLVTACAAHQCCVYIALLGWSQPFIGGHVNEQSHAVYDADGHSMVDFVGRTEEFDADWAELLQHLGARLGTALQYIKPEVANAGVTSTAGRPCPSDLQRRIFNATTLGNIAWQYALDVHRFGFLKAG